MKSAQPASHAAVAMNQSQSRPRCQVMGIIRPRYALGQAGPGTCSPFDASQGIASGVVQKMLTVSRGVCNQGLVQRGFPVNRPLALEEPDLDGVLPGNGPHPEGIAGAL